MLVGIWCRQCSPSIEDLVFKERVHIVERLYSGGFKVNAEFTEALKTRTSDNLILGGLMA